MPLSQRTSRLLTLAVVGLLFGLPTWYVRYEYTRSKRLREVEAGKVYRSGQMTVPGFQDAVERYQIRTIINLQDEYPDPDVRFGFFDSRTVKETELCRQLGVRYVYLPPDLIPRNQVPVERPKSIDDFLTLLDDPGIYPVLLHCKAGLHRTGVMTAVYRMEYDGWTALEALNEVKANGFGDANAIAANDYIMQYILTYRRGLRQEAPCEP